MLVSDDDAQSEVVAFRALRFLNGAVAHLDGQRYRAYRQRIGLISAGFARGGHKALGKVGEIGLVKE